MYLWEYQFVEYVLKGRFWLIFTKMARTIIANDSLANLIDFMIDFTN